VKHFGQLNLEEKNLFSRAYNRALTKRRDAWRMVATLEQKGEGKVY